MQHDTTLQNRRRKPRRLQKLTNTEQMTLAIHERTRQNHAESRDANRQDGQRREVDNCKQVVPQSNLTLT
jgi:hypothetical protein